MPHHVAPFLGRDGVRYEVVGILPSAHATVANGFPEPVCRGEQPVPRL